CARAGRDCARASGDGHGWRSRRSEGDSAWVLRSIASRLRRGRGNRVLESSLYRGISPAMSYPKARQVAEDHYYAALDLFAGGQHDAPVAEYQKSIAADPTFTE